jgi:hypothetical protein
LNRKTKWWFFLWFVLALLISGCNPKPRPVKYAVPYLVLGGGLDVNAAKFNDKFIYTMITAQPENKPESDSAPTLSYPFSLATTTYSSSPNQTGALTEGGKLSEGTIFSKNQTSHDLIMRQAENQALACRASQFSAKSGVNPSVLANITIGTVWNNVNILDAGNSWKLINTTCRHISAHAYFFIDNRDTSAMSTYLTDYGTAFDRIYEVNHTRFGFENDTDSNGKVIIIFTRELTGGLLGYFYPIDKYSKSSFTHSNEGDIFYLTTDSSYQGNVIKGTLAHEFQHMIYFDQHYNLRVTFTFSWLNEALSQAAEFYNNYQQNHLAWISDFLNNHWAGLSLTHWTDDNYGYGAIFIRYLIDQYGDTAIKKMCATDKVGIAAVEAATGADFNSIFNNFTRALVLSGTGDTTNPRYNFKSLDLQDVQWYGRGGLESSFVYNAGNTLTSPVLYSYQIFFARWNGDFGTMNLSGSSVVGTVFGISH